MTSDPATPTTAAADAGSHAPLGAIEVLQALAIAWRGVAAARLSLLGLDAARVAISVAQMLVLTVMVAVMAILTWFLGIGLIILWMVDLGNNGYFVTAGIILAHVLFVICAAVMLQRKQRALGALFFRKVWRGQAP